MSSNDTPDRLRERARSLRHQILDRGIGNKEHFEAVIADALRAEREAALGEVCVIDHDWEPVTKNPNEDEEECNRCGRRRLRDAGGEK